MIRIFGITHGHGDLEDRIRDDCWHRGFHQGRAMRKSGMRLPKGMCPEMAARSAIIQGYVWMPVHLSNDIHQSMRVSA